MPNENNLLPEHAQLAAVLDNPEAIQRIKEPTEKVQIAAVQKKPETCPAIHQHYGKSTAFRRNCLS